MKALVTDGHSRVALAVVRALGQAGVRAVVVEQERFARRAPAAFCSRHAWRREVLPSLESEDAFIEALARAARGCDVILPVSTNVLLACARHAARLPARLPVPPLETIRSANDKAGVVEVARRAGVPVPESGGLEEALSRGRYPVVVKLRDDEGTYLDPGDRYAVCRTPDELRTRYRDLDRVRPSPVVQEFVAGDGYGVGVIAKEGRVLASLCYRREREYPVSGGPSALCVTVRDERLAGYAAAMMRELSWTGAAMVEFRKGEGGYRLMEINPRFWGGLPLATRAGINFPHLLCRMAVGEEFPPVTRYPEGLRLRFLTMDLPAALGAVADPSRRGRYVGGFLRDLFDPGIGDGILDLRDLKASLAYVWSRLP